MSGGRRSASPPRWSTTTPSARLSSTGCVDASRDHRDDEVVAGPGGDRNVPTITWRPAVTGAHDDPVVYGTGIVGALATIASDAERLRVERADGRGVVIDLRPDRYQRWFATKEGEFEAIGGEPRDHAWRLWCRLVLSILTDGLSTSRRLSFVESPEGEVFLVADADGDEPPEAQYEWSAEPGR